MSTTAAPVPEVTPAPAPAAAAPADNKIDPSLKLLFESVEADDAPVTDEPGRGRSLEEALLENDTNPPKKEEPKKKEGEEPAKKEGEPPVVVAPVVAEKPIRGRKKTITPAVAPAPTPEPVAAAAPAAVAPVDPLAGVELLEEEKEQIELAEYAEQKNPEKYKGLKSKMTKFIKDHADYIAAEQKADPDTVFDANNAQYQAWLQKNKPAISSSEVKALERERIADDVRSTTAPEIDRMKDELYRRDAEPVVRRTMDQFMVAAVDDASPPELAKVIKEEGVAKAKEKFPFEFQVVSEVAAGATADMEEFMRLTRRNPETGRPLKAYDAKNGQHTRIVSFVNALCDGFKKFGGKDTIKDGKQFLTRDEYFTIKAPQRGPYWTFTNEEVVDRAFGTVKLVVRNKLKEEEERLGKLGFKRPAAVAAAVAAPTPAAAAAPPAPRGAPRTDPAAPAVEPVSKLVGLMMGDTN